LASQSQLFYDVLKASAGVKVRRSGTSRTDVQTASDGTTGDMIDAVATGAGITYPTISAGASGGLLAALLAFLATPQGQALETALVQMIIALIAGAG
jgi:hypothetical protein